MQGWHGTDPGRALMHQPRASQRRALQRPAPYSAYPVTLNPLAHATSQASREQHGKRACGPSLVSKHVGVWTWFWRNLHLSSGGGGNQDGMLRRHQFFFCLGLKWNVISGRSYSSFYRGAKSPSRFISEAKAIESLNVCQEHTWAWGQQNSACVHGEDREAKLCLESRLSFLMQSFHVHRSHYPQTWSLWYPPHSRQLPPAKPVSLGQGPTQLSRRLSGAGVCKGLTGDGCLPARSSLSGAQPRKCTLQSRPLLLSPNHIAHD